MNRCLILCLLALVFVFNKNYAQIIIPIDQIKYQKELVKQTSEKAIETQFFALCKLSELLVATDTQQSLLYLNKAADLANKKESLQGIYWYYKGLNVAKTESKKNAFSNFDTSISIVNTKKDSISQYYLSHALYTKAYNQIAEKGYDVMVEVLTNQVIPIAQSINNKELEAYYTSQLGLVFMSIGQFEKAIEFHKKAEYLLSGNTNETSVNLVLYHNFVSAYCYLAQGDQAKVYFDKAKKLMSSVNQSSYFTQYFYQEAMYFTTKQQTSNALITLKKGIKNAEKYNQIDLLQMLKFRVYNIYLMQKDYVKGKEVLLNLVNDKVLIQEPLNKKITYQQLASVNEILHNYTEALDWQKKVNVLSDSIQNANLIEKINELEVIHQTNEKQKKIEWLEFQNQQSDLLNKNKQLQISLLIGSIVLILIITLLVYSNFKKQKKLNSEIQRNHEREIDTIESKRKYEATVAVLNGEEKERQRIAQDLHDSLGGMLASIRMGLSLDKSLENNEQIVKIDKAITEVRRISRNLMPESLKNLGLETAMNELCDSMSNPKLEITFESFNINQSLPFLYQLAVYRITQEALSNCIKHAQATKVIVQISQNNELLSLTIEDNGVGFDLKQGKTGHGLQNMKNRAKLLNATLEIVSEKGEGTTINMEANVKTE